MQPSTQPDINRYTDYVIELYQQHDETQLFELLRNILLNLSIDPDYAIARYEGVESEAIVRYCSDTNFSIKQKLNLVRIAKDILIVDNRLKKRTQSSTTTNISTARPNSQLEYLHAIPLYTDDTLYCYLIIKGTRDVVNWPEIQILTKHLGTVLMRIDSKAHQQQQHHHDSAKLTSLFRMTTVLRQIELEGILAGLTELALSTVGGTEACLLLSDENSENLKVATSMGVGQKDIDALIHKQEGHLATFVSQTQQGWLTDDRREFEDFTPSEFLFTLRGFTLLPLSTREGVGCIFIANPEYDTASDLELLEVIISLSCLCIDNAMLHNQVVERAVHKEQLEIAGKVQSRLMPIESPEIEGIDLFGLNIPCDDTSGDYFDYVTLPDGNLCFVLADATGHGIGAAIIATNARAMLRALLLSQAGNIDLPAVCRTLNNLMENDMADDMFITMFIGVIDVHSRTLNYASAGHDPPLLVYQPQTNIFKELPSTGLPIGMFTDTSYNRVKPLALEQGSVLVLSSDGVPETFNEKDELFGRQRVERSIRTHVDKNPADLCRGIVRDVLDFRSSAPQRDDITLIVMKIE